MPSISTEELLAKLKGLPQFRIPNMIPAETASNAGAAVADMGEKLAAPRADVPQDSGDTQALVQQLKGLLNPPPPTAGQAALGAMAQFSRAGFQDPGKAQELENQRTALNQQNMANRARMVMDQIQNQRQQNYQNAEIAARNQGLDLQRQQVQNETALVGPKLRQETAAATTAENLSKGILNPIQEADVNEKVSATRKNNAEATLKELERGNLPQNLQDFTNRLNAIVPANDKTFAQLNSNFQRAAQGVPPNPQAYGDLLKQAEEWARQIDVQRMGAEARFPFQLQLQQGPQFNESYTQRSKMLDEKAKTVDELTKSLGNLRDTLNQNSTLSEALVAPQVLKMMAGGEGSGLRMNQSELNQINNARGFWEGLQAQVSKFNPQDQSTMVLTPEQKQAVRHLYSAMAAKAQAKQALINKARLDLVDAPDIATHKQILANVENALSGVDAGNAPQQGASGRPVMQFGDLPK